MPSNSWPVINGWRKNWRPSWCALSSGARMMGTLEHLDAGISPTHDRVDLRQDQATHLEAGLAILAPFGYHRAQQRRALARP
jgi:hypothetical protein